jgi:glycosyltransferase involved in cell wall biosynthesis
VTRTKRNRFVSYLITRVIAPAAGRLQNRLRPRAVFGCERQIEEELDGPLASAARWLNWVNQGLITLAFPEMQYNPVTARRTLAATQWASQITGLPSEVLRGKYGQYVSALSKGSPGERGAVRFSILISFHRHYRFLQRCIDSVAAACAQAADVPVEVLLVNDDPSFTVSDLQECVTPLLKSPLALHHNEVNLGICASTNLAIKRAVGDWVIHLDCDDELEPDAITVLASVTQNQPNASFVSSRSVDIDENNEILARRLRLENPVQLIDGNCASHLKAIRRDLHERIGYLQPAFEGVQDYEFALRTSLFEPLLFIPQYLYRYRWHSESQTVSEAPRQNMNQQQIRQNYLLAVHWLTHGPKELTLELEGPNANDWRQRLGTSADAQAMAKIWCGHPWSERRHKLLLIELARQMIRRCCFANEAILAGEIPA